MNFFQKMRAIYEYALTGEIIKNPLRLLKFNKIGVIVRYLSTHDLDNYSIEVILNV